MKSSRNVQQLSAYRRLQRFFKQVRFDAAILASCVMRCLSSDGPVYLAMDRTQWAIGNHQVNMLVLAVVYRGIGMPVYWRFLSHRGNSDTALRIQLMRLFIDDFGVERIKGLLADREFIGGPWFKWLDDHRITYYIRIKNNVLTTNARGLEVDIDGLFYGLEPGEVRVLPGKRRVFNQSLYLSGTLSQDGDLLIVASNVNTDQAIAAYRKRWGIETLFGCLKSKGFDFEATRMRDHERLSTLLAVLALAFVWTYYTGQWRVENEQPIKLKKHGRAWVSVFRYGLDYMQQILLNRSGYAWRRVLNLLRKILKIPTTKQLLDKSAFS